MKMHNLKLLPLELLLLAQIYGPNRLSAGALPQTHWGAYIAPPDSLVGLGVGTTGNGKEGGKGKRRDGRGGEGRASRNAQIQSWQAYAGPRLWNTLPEDITSVPSLLLFQRKLKTHYFVSANCNLTRTLHCSLCGMLRPVVLKVFT